MNTGLVTVFGGSGFVGKHVVRALVKQGWRVRVTARRPHTANDLKVIGNVGQVQIVQANLRFKTSVERAVHGADAVVNLAAILYEQGKQSFKGVHVVGANNIAEAAAAAGISNVVHISAIGASADALSDYSQTKAAGEQALRDAVPSADILRPSIIFGPEDAFFNRFAAMAQMTPALPLIGGGEPLFQPVYVGDVADAIAARLQHGSRGQTYELGGPRTYTFKELMQFLLATIDRRRLLIPVPWFAANILGFAGDIMGALPIVKPFLTRDQVKSLRTNTVVSDDALSFQDIFSGDFKPETIEAIVPPYLEHFRKYGQFYEKRA